MRRRVRPSCHRFSNPRSANTWPMQHAICIASHRRLRLVSLEVGSGASAINGQFQKCRVLGQDGVAFMDAKMSVSELRCIAV